MAAIHKILIANRGEIARRIIRTARLMGIVTVAVCSDADRGAPFVLEADEFVPLGGLQPAESYLRADAIIEAAKRSGADAIHPGYGFLAENAAFARACRDAGITFIGPSPEVIAAMGSKIEAKRRMQAAGVPLLPTVEVGTQSADKVLKQVEALDWPVLIKASAGGGGRGMRIARSAAEFPALLEAARQEAQSAFGDGTLFVEPYVESSRHVEVQIFGDTHGNVIHLYERECSIQRRHQKIIEEAPSPAVDDDLRGEMTSAAVRGAKEIGYVNAGTFEFLLTPQRKFYFLEVNTRLQVEHPATELIMGVDLVRLQILIASGEAIPEGFKNLKPRGHAIEARLCAEDPAKDFMPVAGRLSQFDLSVERGVRVDAAFDGPTDVSPYYDSMLAKLIVSAHTRAEAARRLSRALARAKIHGLSTNRELLVRTLAHEEFLAGNFDTHFLQRHDAAALAAPLGDLAVERLHAAAAALAAQSERRQSAPVLGAAPSGWRNNPSARQTVTFRGASGEIKVEYLIRRGRLELVIDGEEQGGAACEIVSPGRVRLTVAGLGRSYDVTRSDDTYYVDSPLGASVLVELPRFPRGEEAAAAGSLAAPLPGVVNDVRIQAGDEVAAGDVLLVIDSMKMLHEISAPVSGRIAEVRVGKGQQVDAGAILIVIDESDGAAG